MSILKYFINISFCLCIGTAFSQTVKQDSIPPAKETYGLRAGIDIYRLARSVYDKDYTGLELAGDFRMTKKIYLAGELGNENKTVDDDRVNFTTRGTYFKVGADYNMYENWLDMDNQIYLGLRYAVSSFSQELNTYKIYTPHPYFGDLPNMVSGQKYNGLSAHWVEVVAGIKAEIFNNFYAGFSVKLNRLVSENKPNNFDNLFIPGYNRTYDSKYGVGINYTITYSIPVYKKDKKKKEN
ncbi:MAG: DUF6048 family protein [Flavobacteriaceae bacterium]|jgi:hypothetical protein|nr:DUF6048 family protein [Flavobacteriaceae bacterium]